MTDKKFKVGDRVRQTGPSELGFTENMGQVGVIKNIFGDGSFDVHWDNGNGNTMKPESVEHVKRSRAACILTEKITVGGVPCRKILGFECILPCDALPEKYMGGKPRFFLSDCTDSKYMFDGEVHRWVVHGCKIGIECVKYEIPEQSNPEVILDVMPIYRLAADEVYSEVTFQAIVMWLKRAGSRLAKIRKQEKDAWSGKETIEI